MIKYTKRDGYTYTDERTGREYSLLEMKSYGGETTSDIIMIWDTETDTPANWVYGASLYEHDAQRLDTLIAEYLEANRKNAGTVRYKFNPVGAKCWKDDVIDDICDRGICGDFEITHKGRTISLPDTAYAYEVICNAIDEAISDDEFMWEGIV